MPSVHVAVGVIFDSTGKICIAKRPPGKHLSGLWEFPGGKVESGETTFVALQRELEEELSIHIHSSQPLMQIEFAYPGKTVLLDVHTVDDFSGRVFGRENQVVEWVNAEELSDYPFPEANQRIIEAILARRNPDR